MYSRVSVLALLLVSLAAAPVRSAAPLPPLLSDASQAVAEVCGLIQSRYSTPVSQLQGYAIDECPFLSGCAVEQDSSLAWQCNSTYGKGQSCGCTGLRISADQAITMVPTTTNAELLLQIKETKCRTGDIGPEYSAIAKKYGLITLYSGFQTGVHVSWPTRDWAVTTDEAGCRIKSSTCPPFEPRFRNWYVAASAGPKNVVIILDISGSMTNNNRLSIAKDAAKTVLDTLTFADFVNIVIFSSDARLPTGFTSGLYRATQANIDLLKVYIDQLVANGATDYTAAFDLAFNVLQSSPGSECHNIILFLTDGTITEGLEGDAFLTHLAGLNTAAISAKIFTYVLGADANPDVPKKIACAHKGVFAAIPDRGDLRTKMGQYYLYLAAGAVRQTAVFAEPFIECCGMGNITSVSLACYSGESPPQLIGVAASSIPMKMLEEQIELIRGAERCTIDAATLHRILWPSLFPVYIAIIVFTGCMIRSCVKKRRRERQQAQAAAAAAAVQLGGRGGGIAPSQAAAPKQAVASSSAAAVTEKKKKRKPKNESASSSTSTSSSSSSDSSDSDSESDSIAKEKKRAKKAAAASTVATAEPSSLAESLPGSTECKICMDAKIDTVFAPCGHMAACHRCALQNKICPICRQDIDQVIKTYKA